MIGETDHSTYKPALTYHPLANLFPMIEGPERVAFRQSIRDKGLRVRIVMHEGMILDGRNRYRELLGLQLIDHSTDWKASPYFRTFGSEETDGESPLDFVMDLNLDRRHLNESQRASVAARMATMKRENRPDLKEGSSLGEAVETISRAEAAERLNVSERSVTSAKKVQDQGAPELIEAVDQGVLPVSVAEKLLTLPKDEQSRLVTEETPAVIKNAAKKATRIDKEQKLAAKQKALPNKRYGVIYEDPAWRFEPRSRETGLDRAADNHYPTMTIEDLRKLPVADIAAPDCVLFVWATVPFLAEALDLIERRGFKYKSCTIWDKTPWDGDGAGNEIAGRQGQGFWFRVNHELLLVATRGNPPCPAPGDNLPSVYREVAGEHSAKPEYFARMIEGYYPNLAKIELNARAPRQGWDVWGNESEGKDAKVDAPLPEVVAGADVVDIYVPGLPARCTATISLCAFEDGTFGQRSQYSFLERGRKGAFVESSERYSSLADALTVAMFTLKQWVDLIEASDSAAVTSKKAAVRVGAWISEQAKAWALDLAQGDRLYVAAREAGKIAPHALEEVSEASDRSKPVPSRPATNSYLASLNSSPLNDLEFRRTPDGEPTVADLVHPGTLVRSHHGTAYIVVSVSGPFFYAPDRGPFKAGISAEEASVAKDRVYPHYSLVLAREQDFLEKPTAKSLKDGGYINELVAVGGRLLHLFANNDSEDFITGFNADAAKLLGASTEPPLGFFDYVQADPRPDFLDRTSCDPSKTFVTPTELLEYKVITAIALGIGGDLDGPIVRQLLKDGDAFRDSGRIDLTERGWGTAERLKAQIERAESDGVVNVVDVGFLNEAASADLESVSSVNNVENLVNADYIAALEAVAPLRGKLHQSTAAAVMQAAYAAEPPIPVAKLAQDLGHPVGTVKTWANRLGLTSRDRMLAAQERAPAFSSTNQPFNQLADEVPDINGDAVKAGLKVTLTEDVVATTYEVRRVYKNGSISISNATGHQQVVKAGEFVLAYEASYDEAPAE